MEYERALFRVYERVLDDLNRSPSPLVLASTSNGGNSSAATTNLVDTEQPQPQPQQLSNVDPTLPFMWCCFCTTSSSTSIQQDSTMSISSTATAAVENPFHQRALVRLHSWTSSRRRGSTAEQQGSDDVGRRTGARQRRRQHPTTINQHEDEEEEEEVLIHPNAHETSPLRSSPPNNHLNSSSTSPTNTTSTRTISFGGQINMNPFAPPPPNSFLHQDDDGNSQKFLQSIMYFSFGLAMIHILFLALLHSTYIRPDTSSSLFHHTTIRDYYRTLHLPPPPPPPYHHHNDNHYHQSSSSSSSKMQIMIHDENNQLIDTTPTNNRNNNTNTTQQDIQFYLGKTCIERALSTRPIQLFYNATHNETNNFNITHVNTTTTPTFNALSEQGITHSTNNSNPRNDNDPKNSSSSWAGEWVAFPLLRSDELLQINIIYGDIPSCLATNMSDEQPKQCSTSTIHSVIEYPSSSINTNSKNSTNIDWSNSIHWDKPTYRFSTLEALLHVDNQFLWTHNISIVNLTVTERCLSSGADTITANIFTKSAEILAQVYGIDAVIINQLMYGIRAVDGSYRDGFLLNTETEERWSWRKEFMEITDPRELDHNQVGWWINTKLNIVFLSLLSFFLVTSSTALIVRILTSSGVVLMFPIFAWLRLLGVHNVDDRILGLSYPWIGRARSVVRLRSIYPDSHLMYAHLLRIVLYYIMYEASQAAWSVVLYGKSIPNGLAIWIYGFTMIWEYYSLIFVRSALGVYFFPRVTLLYFLGFHFYFYSVPYGYFDCALIPLFFFMVHAMIYSLLAFEVPAARRGSVSLECPREVYSRISWPEWTASLPQEWTLFLPLNSRYVPLHDRDVEITVRRHSEREQS